MTDTQTTFFLLTLFGILDFVIYYPVYEKHPGCDATLYHIIQFIIYVSVPFILYLTNLINFSPQAKNLMNLSLTYFLMFTGYCDMIYIIIWLLINNKPYMSFCKWFWWSFPSGWLKTISLSWHYKRFLRGEIKFSTFKIQVAAGLVIYFLIKILWLN